MLKSFAVLAFAILLIGCEQPSSDGSGDGGSNLPHANLLGFWTNDCKSEGGSATSSTIEFGGEESLNMTYVATSYTGAACTDPQGMAFRYGGAATVSGQSLDIMNARIYFRPLHTMVVDSMNNTNYCGISNWQLNVEREVTGANCGGTPMPTQVYSIVKTESGRLYIGENDSSHDGTTPATRPVAFDPTPYRR